MIRLSEIQYSKVCLMVLIIGLGLPSVQAQNVDDYISLALTNSPTLKAKYKAFEAAATKVDQVGNLPDPGLSFGYFI